MQHLRIARKQRDGDWLSAHLSCGRTSVKTGFHHQDHFDKIEMFRLGEKESPRSSIPISSITEIESFGRKITVETFIPMGYYRSCNFLRRIQHE